jgi:hypothetical protein
MKLVKSLILGSAAGLVAMSGAQAADLPVKAKAVEYVRICSLYGAGFFYIPGTDTCLKLGGYMRVDTTFNGGVYDAPAWSGDLGQGNRWADRINSRSRMALTVDTRTATEYGVVRTFLQGDFQFQNFGTTNGAVIGAAAGTPVLATQLGGLNNALLSSPGGGFVAVEFAFIQFAGFTFGKSASAYATPWHGYPGNNSSFLLGGHDTVTGVNNIQYSAQFGNGVSGTIGLDDPTVFNRTPLANLGNGIGAAGQPVLSGYGGFVAPDLVGNIRVDQAWGLFQISGALHTVNASYNLVGPGNAPVTGATALTDSILSGHPGTKLGGSAMVAFQIKNIPTGQGDDIKFDASWAKGDTKNVIATSGSSPTFLMIGGVPGQFGSSGSLGFGPTNDGIFLPRNLGALGGPYAIGAAFGDGNIHLTTAFGLRGAFNHNWDPYWSSSLFGSWSWVRHDNTSKAEYCAVAALTIPGQGLTYTCNPDYNISQLGVITRWTPVTNLTFSAETMWTHLHSGFSGTSLPFSPGNGLPVQPWTFRNQDTLTLNVRVQRNF